MRRAAVLSLRWRDVDFDTGLIRVRQQVQRIQDELHISPVKPARATGTSHGSGSPRMHSPPAAKHRPPTGPAPAAAGPTRAWCHHQDRQADRASGAIRGLLEVQQR